MGAKIGWNNLLLSDNAVITSSSEATGHAADNLSFSARWRDWQSDSATTDQWVKFDLGSNQSMQVLAAIDPVIHTGGTLKIQAHTSDSWGSPTIDYTVTFPTTNYTGVRATWRSAAQSLRWVRFYFTNTGAVAAPVSLGAVFAGTYLEPSRSLSPALTLRRVDPSVQRYAVGGQRSAVLRAKYHEVSGTFPIQAVSARDDLRAMYETIGATEPVLFAVDSADPSLVFYGTLQSTLTAQNRGPDLWDLPIEFVEDVA